MASRKKKTAGAVKSKAARAKVAAEPAPAYDGTPDALSAEDIARRLQEISALLEILGENAFKVRAYENAARVLPGLADELVEAIEGGHLERVRGIGRGIAEKIVRLAYTGESPYYDELKARVPPGLLEMLRVPGLGPKKVKLLFDSMDISSVEALEAACQSGALADLRGFGAKTQENILRGIAYLRRVSARFFWSTAHENAYPVFEALRDHAATQRAQLAGSLRRRKESVHDVDIVVATRDAETVSEHFASGPWVERVIGSGPTKTSILHPSGLQIDLRVVTDEQYPYALHHFTGSKAHNVAMRGRAQRMGIKINEYGLFRGDELIECRTEEDIFAALGLQYVPPELREDEGEIEAAETNELPERLLEPGDVTGAFHVNARDGDILRAARQRGWAYVGVHGHDQAASAPAGLRVFRGIEADILEDGRLAPSEDALGDADFVIAAVGTARDLPRAEQTRRVLRALDNPRTTFLAHTTGRKLFDEPALDLDLGAVFEAAARSGVIVEISGHPQRMDPDGSQIRLARDKGARLAVSPDADDAHGLGNVEQAVGLARRGWLGPEHVFNTWPVERVAEHLRAARHLEGS